MIVRFVIFRSNSFAAALGQCGKRKKCLEHITPDQYLNHQKRIKGDFQDCPAQSKEMRLRIHAALQAHKDIIHGTTQRIGLTYQEKMEIDGEVANVTLCEDCFVNVQNHVCKKTYNNWKKQAKWKIQHDPVGSHLMGSVLKTRKVRDSTTMHYRNIIEARKDLGRFQDISEEALHMACLPSGARYRQAYLWMSNFFSLIGDSAPNRDNKVQLPGIYTKTSIYEMYVKHISSTFTADEHKPLSKTRFVELWKNIYPNVTITRD